MLRHYRRGFVSNVSYYFGGIVYGNHVVGKKFCCVLPQTDDPMCSWLILVDMKITVNTNMAPNNQQCIQFSLHV